MKSAYVGWIITLSGILFATLGHFSEGALLFITYIFCGFVGLITSIVLIDMKD